MRLDIIELRNFYNTRIGRLAERHIAATLKLMWRDLPEERLVGLGYTLPFLNRYCARTDRTFAFMPGGQGALSWPSKGPSSTALVFEEDLPLPDSAVDRILMVHCLEFVENPDESLREMWRVLAPAGRLILVVPNRSGVWARFDHTPFGSGQPYSRGQLNRLLRQANFTLLSSAEALFFPPSQIRTLLRFSRLWEKLGRSLWPAFGGVIIVEAQKRLYQGIPAVARPSRRVFVPVVSPQGIPTTRAKIPLKSDV